MTTVYFVWNDGKKSTESFSNNTEFYAYMKKMSEDGFFPVSMDTDRNDDLVGDGYDNENGEWVKIEEAGW